MAVNWALVLILGLFIGLTGSLVIMGGKIVYRLFVGLYEEIHQYSGCMIWGCFGSPFLYGSDYWRNWFPVAKKYLVAKRRIFSYSVE